MRVWPRITWLLERRERYLVLRASTYSPEVRLVFGYNHSVTDTQREALLCGWRLPIQRMIREVLAREIQAAIETDDRPRASPLAVTN